MERDATNLSKHSRWRSNLFQIQSTIEMDRGVKLGATPNSPNIFVGTTFQSHNFGLLTWTAPRENYQR